MMTRSNDDITYNILAEEGKVQPVPTNETVIYSKEPYPEHIINNILIVSFGSAISDATGDNHINVPDSRNIGAVDQSGSHMWFIDHPLTTIDHNRYRRLFHIRGNLICQSTASPLISGYSRVNSATGAVQDTWPSNEYREPRSRITMDDTINGIDEAAELVILQTESSNVVAIDEDLNVVWAYNSTNGWMVDFENDRVVLTTQYVRDSYVSYHIIPETGEIEYADPENTDLLTPKMKYI